MIGTKRIRVAAMIAAALIILAVLLLPMENDGKAWGVAVVLGALTYVVCVSLDIEDRSEEFRQSWPPLAVSTVCYVLASATLSEVALEIIDRWGSGDAGLAMMFFFRVVILPSSCIGFAAAIFMTRMRLWSGAMLLTFHALMIFLVVVPMLVH